VTSNPFRVLGAPMLKPALSAARGRHTKDRPSTGSRPYEQHCRSADPCSQGRDSSYAARLPKPSRNTRAIARDFVSTGQNAGSQRTLFNDSTHPR